MRVLVCGGAGYLGSVLVRKLLEAEIDVAVFDNFSTGHRQALNPGVKVIEGNLLSKEEVFNAVNSQNFHAVVHAACLSDEKSAYENPYLSLNYNYISTLNILEAMKLVGVKKLVLASSSSIYGVVDSNPVREESRMVISGPFGESFYSMEKLLGWYEFIAQIKSVSLRMADLAGATIDGNLGEDKGENAGVVSQAVKASLGDCVYRLNGNNYQTLDGTLVRDYLHVDDAAFAIVKALEFLNTGNRSDVFNISCGRQYSVKEIVAEVEDQSGKKLNIVPSVRKRGDKDVIYMDISKALRDLQYAPAFELPDMVQSSMYWFARYPKGFA